MYKYIYVPYIQSESTWLEDHHMYLEDCKINQMTQ